MRSGTQFRPPVWSWSYVTFRFGDGFTNALVSLAVVLHYDRPLWALAVLTACLNLASVPASFFWGRVMERSLRRRRWVVAGFSVAALAQVALALLPPFPLYVLAGMVLYFFGVATSPASSTLVIQNLPRKQWAFATSRLSRRTGFAFLLGTATSTAVAFTGHLDLRAAFAAGALLTAAAALIALRHVPHRARPLPHESGYETGVVQATARRFERAVYLPLRMFIRPNFANLRQLAAPQRLWPLGYALIFSGSVCFFASYTGLLATHLGLGAGLVLLCQVPSHIVSPLTYPWAGRLGARIGESRGIRLGAGFRMLAVPALCVVLIATDGGLVGLGIAIPLLLVLHGVMGLSFALLQVNGPVLMAEGHPAGRGPGVGAFHAAVGLGTLTGSLIAFVLLRAFDSYLVSYGYALVAGTVGGWLLFRAHQRHVASPPQPSSPKGVVV